MPIYEYTCINCNERFSVLQGMHSQNDTECPNCSSKDVKKAISIFSCASDSGSQLSSFTPSPHRSSGGG